MWSVFKCGTVFRERVGVLSQKFVAMLIGMISSRSINFVVIHSTVLKLCANSYFPLISLLEHKQDGRRKYFRRLVLFFIVLSRGSPMWVLQVLGI